GGRRLAVPARARGEAGARGGPAVGLLAYGGASALRTLLQAYANWTSYGLPGLADFALQVVRIDDAPAGNGRVWTELRGGTVLVWHPLPGAEDWQALLRKEA